MEGRCSLPSIPIKESNSSISFTFGYRKDAKSFAPTVLECGKLKTVTVESGNTAFSVDADGVLDIYQKIVVANDAHKKIVIGRGGEQLKKIGTDARHDIQDQWGVNARLHLFVRVEENWEDMAENYTDQGLEFKK